MSKSEAEVRISSLMLVKKASIQDGFLLIEGGNWRQLLPPRLPYSAHGSALTIVELGRVRPGTTVLLRWEARYQDEAMIAEGFFEVARTDEGPVSRPAVGIPIQVPLKKEGILEIAIFHDDKELASLPLEVKVKPIES